MINLTKVNNINHLWGKLIIEELIRCGVDYFCISPGSRSTPLVMGVAENRNASSCVHFDERGLSYHALGYASLTGKPVCVIVTSGTAVANCFPAVMEASKKKVPLIILTADRPAELRNTGANQTIDQVKIYGDYARFFFDMPCPSADMPVEMVLTTIDQAVYRSKSSVPGPVHINCMFREPLVPSKSKGDWKPDLNGIKQWAQGELPFTGYKSYEKCLARDVIENISEEIGKINKGIIVVGKLRTTDEENCVLRLTQRLNWPVFPDISSGLRLKSRDEHIIHYFDQVLLAKDALKKYAPDGILHLGGRITSRRLQAFIQDAEPKRYIMVLNHPLRNDPLHRVTLRIESAVDKFCDSVLKSIKPRKEKGYAASLRKASDKVFGIIDEHGRKQSSLDVPALIHGICKLTSKKAGLFLSNSMSIRVMDMFACPNDNFFAIGANRGASGIDGIIASASGFAKGLNAPCVLLLGDLAFLHDLNSLSLLKSIKQPFIIIVLNDDGGGIFSFLPIAGFPEVFEKYFVAPHGLNFETAAKMFGIPYYRPKDYNDFADSYKKAFNEKRAAIIEVKLNRDDNLKTINSLQKQILK